MRWGGGQGRGELQISTVSVLDQKESREHNSLFPSMEGVSGGHWCTLKDQVRGHRKMWLQRGSGKMHRPIWLQSPENHPRQGSRPQEQGQQTGGPGLAWTSAVVWAGRQASKDVLPDEDKGLGVLVDCVCSPDHTDTFMVRQGNHEPFLVPYGFQPYMPQDKEFSHW